MENIYKMIGIRVREERKNLGLTQEELAERVDLSSNFLGHIERGTKKASLETIKKLSDGLEIPIRNLFGKAEKYKPQKKDSLIRKIYLVTKNKNPSDKKLILKIAKRL